MPGHRPAPTRHPRILTWSWRCHEALLHSPTATVNCPKMRFPSGWCCKHLEVALWFTVWIPVTGVLLQNKLVAAATEMLACNRFTARNYWQYQKPTRKSSWLSLAVASVPSRRNWPVCLPLYFCLAALLRLAHPRAHTPFPPPSSTSQSDTLRHANGQ